MAFPQVDCPTELPDECCSTLFDTGTEILAFLATYMDECATPTGCCGEPIRYFVSIGRPETWQSDFLAIYVENLRPDSGSERSGRTLIPPSLMVAWRLILIESCYPGLIEIGQGPNGVQYATPTDDEFHLAARYGYARAQALMRGVLAFATQNDCQKYRFRDLQPLRAENYTAGWSLGFDLEL